VGVGNAASALVQGIKYYADPEAEPIGITFTKIGLYSTNDIKVAIKNLKGGLETREGAVV